MHHPGVVETNTGSRAGLTLGKAFLFGTVGLVIGGVAAARLQGGPLNLTIKGVTTALIGAGLGWLVGAVAGWTWSGRGRPASRASAWALRLGAGAFVVLAYLILVDVRRKVRDRYFEVPNEELFAMAGGSVVALVVVTLLVLLVPGASQTVVREPRHVSTDRVTRVGSLIAIVIVALLALIPVGLLILNSSETVQDWVAENWVPREPD